MMDAPDLIKDAPPAVADTHDARRLRRTLFIAGAVLVALFLAGLIPRLHLWHRLDERARAQRDAVPSVGTAHPERAAAVADVPLPGTTEPIFVTSIYARTNGYLTARYVDIEQLCLSPQCGFSSTYEGNSLTMDEQRAKLALVVETAAEVWGD